MTTHTPREATTETAAVLAHGDGTLLRDGMPHRILSGSLHYFRVHPRQWADRLERLSAMGLNTVDTYIAWNFHERDEGEPDFTGWRDVERFIGLAADTGLDVVVRPGPYICAEWDNGGLPAWLTARPGIRLRCSDPVYLDAVSRWFDELIPRLTSLQAANGGPITAVQVENEYGSYGDDHAYMAWMRDALVERGVTELLYTADGPTELMQDGGGIPGVLATATLGSRAKDAARLLRARRPGAPFLAAEFWNGWFDHWGERHHVRSPASAAETASEILANGSISVYMAHGGTNFGLWAGANHDGERLQPTVTSYDSDAPIAENGALTPKFLALREALAPGSAAARLPLPSPPTTLAPTTLPVTRRAGLLEGLRGAAVPVASAGPLSFEELGQASGLVLHRATPVVPRGETELRIDGVRDRAIVFADGEPLGVVEDGDGVLPLEGRGEPVSLEILVENQGRINYGHLLGQGKGVLGSVRIERRIVHGWENVGLPLDRWSGAELDAAASASGPVGARGFATAVLEVEEPDDTFLAFPGFGKGFAWVNGFLLGRYWEIGPQETLYLPGPLLHAGANEITVLELSRLGGRVELRARASLGEAEEFVETF